MDKRQRYLFIDTETTGLDPIRNSVIEIAMRVEEEDKNFVPKEIAVLRAKFPKSEYTMIDLTALQVNKRAVSDVNVTMDENNREMRKAHVLGVAQFLTDHVTKDTLIIGINVKFDIDFLIALLAEYNISIKEMQLMRNAIDLQHVARMLNDKGAVELPNFRGVTLAQMFLEYKPNEFPHNALADCNITRDLYFAMRNFI